MSGRCRWFLAFRLLVLWMASVRVRLSGGVGMSVETGNDGVDSSLVGERVYWVDADAMSLVLFVCGQSACQEVEGLSC